MKLSAQRNKQIGKATDRNDIIVHNPSRVDAMNTQIEMLSILKTHITFQFVSKNGSTDVMAQDCDRTNYFQNKLNCYYCRFEKCNMCLWPLEEGVISNPGIFS